jgi:hypothetical protein
MSYSPKLEYFCSRLEGLSTGVFRLEAQNQTSNIQPQSIIRFTLPSNALVAVNSFALHFNAQTTAGSGTIAHRLPDDISSLINRVEVSVGGVSVSSGTTFYNVLKKVKDIVESDKKDAGMDHPEIITTGGANNYVDATNLTNAEAPDSTNGKAQFCIDKWYGFLGECQPEVLDSSLLGDIVISLFLENPNLCVSVSDDVTNSGFVTCASGNPAASYTLNNVYATVVCYNLASGVLDNMIAEQMAMSGSLEVGFKQYFSFRDSMSGSSRFVCATQSMDRILVCHHKTVNPTGANRAPHAVLGYNTIPDTTNPSTLAGTSAASRPLGLGKMMYKHPYSVYSKPVASAGTEIQYEFQLNGAKYPQFRASSYDMYNIMRNASTSGRIEKEWGLAQYDDAYNVNAIKLTLDAPNARFIQGLDTRSVSLNGYYYIYNAAGPVDITLFCECTSSLMISAGRQIAVVQ